MFATLVQNVGIHIGHHFGLGVTGIALHRFDVTAIEFQLVCYPSNGRCWSLGQDQMYEIMCGWCNYELREIDDAHERAVICGIPDDAVRKGVYAIMLSESLEESQKKASKVYIKRRWLC